MPESASPTKLRAPFRADHVGSFLRPPQLRKAMEVGAADISAMQNECIRNIVAMQEQAGLAVVTDGEFRHTSWHNFLESLEGLSVVKVAAPTKVAGSFEPRSYRVHGRLRHTRPIEVESFKFLKSASKVTPKVTLASPTMLLRAGREGISADIYPDLDQFHADVAAVYQTEITLLGDAGCRYVQVDDTNFAYLCDPEFRGRRQLGGEDPRDVTQRYTKLINAAISRRHPAMAVCVHICRGNSAGSFAAKGGYEPVADVLLNALDVDGYFLEYDDERSGGFEPLRFLPKNSKKRIVLGLVSTKRPEIETKDLLKRRVDEAAKIVPLENLCISPQCGFASNFKGNPVSEDIQRRKIELVVETARDIWGSAQ